MDVDPGYNYIEKFRGVYNVIGWIQMNFNQVFVLN